MGLLDTLRAMVRPDPSVSALRLQPWSSPPKRGSIEMLRGYKTMPWLRAVTSRVGDACANVELVVRKRDSKGKLSDPLTSGPLVELLRRPNPMLTHRASRKLAHLHLDMLGESFWIKERARNGEVVEILPVPPTWIREVPGPTRTTFRLQYQHESREIAREDIIWIRDIDPEEPYGRGTGLASSLADELDTDEYAAKHVKAFFFNRATPEAIVSIDGAEKATLKAYREDWDANHRGVANAFRTLFTGKKVDVSRLDTAFRDMQLVQLRDAQRDRIVSVFGLPPEVLGILTSSNRATIDAADVLMSKYVVAPRLDMFTDGLNAGLAWEFGDDLVIEYVNPVPDDREFTKNMIATRPTAFTDNEARETAGLPPAKGKDEFPEPSPFGALSGKDQDPPWTRMLPARHKRNAATQADARRALEALRPESLTTRIDPVMQDGVESWSKRILADLGADAKFDLLNPLIPKFVEEQSATKIAGYVHEDTQKALRETLTEGVRAGESIDDLQVRIEDVFAEADEVRSERIARTEVVGASNWATREAQKASGVVEKRAWVATRGDGRTRASHAAMDGVEASIDAPFKFVEGENAGATVEYPGGSGIAEEDIQCRCTTVAVISDDLDETASAVHAGNVTTERLDAVFRVYDRALAPWERSVKTAAEAGFAEQRRDVLRALKQK